MATWRYKAVTLSGQTKSGAIEASSKDTAIQALLAKGQMPQTIHQIGGGVGYIVRLVRG